jgi:hypothetical protein
MKPPEKRSKDAVFYIGCSDVELAYQELTDRGLKAERPKLAPYGLKLFSVADPDGGPRQPYRFLSGAKG